MKNIPLTSFFDRSGQGISSEEVKGLFFNEFVDNTLEFLRKIKKGEWVAVPSSSVCNFPKGLIPDGYDGVSCPLPFPEIQIPKMQGKYPNKKSAEQDSILGKLGLKYKGSKLKGFWEPDVILDETKRLLNALENLNPVVFDLINLEKGCSLSDLLSRCKEMINICRQASKARGRKPEYHKHRVICSLKTIYKKCSEDEPDISSENSNFIKYVEFCFRKLELLNTSDNRRPRQHIKKECNIALRELP